MWRKKRPNMRVHTHWSIIRKFMLNIHIAFSRNFCIIVVLAFYRRREITIACPWPAEVPDDAPLLLYAKFSTRNVMDQVLEIAHGVWPHTGPKPCTRTANLWFTGFRKEGTLCAICFSASALTARRTHGWQMQQNAVSVQQGLFRGARKCTPRESGRQRLLAHGRGRPRKPVLRVPSRPPAHPVRTPRVRGQPFPAPDIAAWSCREVPLSFHARYDCRGKEYVYLIWNARVARPVFIRAVRCTTGIRWMPNSSTVRRRRLWGYHDFTSFCTPRSAPGPQFLPHRDPCVRPARRGPYPLYGRGRRFPL